MSEYQYVAEEIRQIDELYAKNYKIQAIVENLEGAFVTFVNDMNDEQLLHIKMADTRKYFSAKLREQLTN